MNTDRHPLGNRVVARLPASVRRVGIPFLGLSMFFVPFSIMRTVQDYEIFQRAALYRQATFEVRDGNCSGGNQAYDQRGKLSSGGDVRCTLHGTIDGVEEELLADVQVVEDTSAGSTVEVWYAPELDAWGVDGQGLRVLWDQGRHPRDSARRGLWTWPIFFALIAFWLLVLDRLYVYSGYAPWARGARQQLILAGPSAAPSFGFAFAALGLLLLALLCQIARFRQGAIPCLLSSQC